MPKFVKRDKKSKLLESFIAEENSKRSIPQVNSTFDPICLTECPRRIMYRSLGTPYSTSESYIDNQAKLATLNKWIRIFGDCHKIKLIDRDVVTADSKYNITGKVHAIISLEDDVFIIQIKSVCNEVFTDIKNGGALKKDVIELIVYLWLLELGNGLVIYDNNDNGEYLVFHVEPYSPIINSIRKKCETMMGHKMNNMLVERPYEDASSAECKTCEFLSKCWK